MKKQSFLHGAAILAGASILCKIMSAAFKIPLDNIFLHEEGIGVYQSAYSIYNVFLAFCVTGIPIALSSLVAGSDEKEAAALCKSTCVFVTVLSTVFAILLFVFSEPLARLLSGGGAAVASPSLKVLAPALLAMGIISSRRGYFQGKSMMTPSGISQLAESLIKIALGIGLCAVFVKYGIAYGAAGAIAGVSIGAIASAAVLELFFRRAKPERGEFSFKKALSVFKISIPMTLGAFAFTAVMLLDTLSVPQILANIGAGETERLKLFGLLTRANTIYNLPATVISAFTASAVPALAYSRTDKTALGETSLRAIKLIFLAALPCALGMVLFPKELLLLIYSSKSHWELLALTGVMVVIMPYVQTTTAMLQTLGKVWAPIYVTAGAVVLKAFLNIIFIPAYSVAGAPLATICAFVPAVIINTAMLMRKAPLKGGTKIISKITLCALISCGGARILYALTGGVGALLVCIALAAGVYFALVVITKCITKSEFLGKGTS